MNPALESRNETVSRVVKVNKLQSIDSLQVLRGVAALIVLVHHSLGTIRNPKNYDTTFLWDVFSTGQFGVDIFFVLSGFIIFLTNFKPTGSLVGLANYSLKRTLRIYPVYWVVCIAYFLPYYLVPGFGDSNNKSLLHGIYSFFLFPTNGNPALGVAWTLQFEMMFYMLFLPFVFNRRLGWIFWSLLAVFAVSFSLRGHEFKSPAMEQLFSLRILEFLMGGVVCVVSQKFPSRKGDWFTIGGILAMIVMVFCELKFGKRNISNIFLYYALASSFLIYGLASMAKLGQGVRQFPRWLMALGAYSYSIYLVHRPVQQALVKISVKLTGGDLSAFFVGLITVGVILFSLLIGCLIGKLVEVPSQRYFRKWKIPSVS